METSTVGIPLRYEHIHLKCDASGIPESYARLCCFGKKTAWRKSWRNWKGSQEPDLPSKSHKSSTENKKFPRGWSWICPSAMLRRVPTGKCNHCQRQSKKEQLRMNMARLIPVFLDCQFERSMRITSISSHYTMGIQFSETSSHETP